MMRTVPCGRRMATVRPRRAAALFLTCAGCWLATRSPEPRCYSVPTSFSGTKSYTLDEKNVLGSGAYGSVYQCRDNTGIARAVKVIPMWRMQLDNKRDQMRATLEHEIEVQQHIGLHEHIVQLVDSVDIEGDVGGWPRWKMVVLELSKGGELSDLIEQKGKLPEEQAKHIFRQLVKGVQHLHSKRVIHRDLKSDNVLICSDKTTDPNKPFVKLIDFGAGHWQKEDGPVEATSCTGTMQTMAPEVILARGDDFDASDESQIDQIHEAEFRVRPFGVRRYAPGPGGIGARVVEMVTEQRYKGDPLAQAWVKGVQTGWVVKSVNGKDVTKMAFDDIIDLMGDRLLDNSSRGAFDGSFKVTGDNKGKGKVLPKVEMVDLPATVQYAELKKKPYGVKVDVWSLGVILYQMVSGQMPFPADEGAIVKGEYTPIAGASAQVTDLLSKMLKVDPAQRLDMAAVAAHPWLA